MTFEDFCNENNIKDQITMEEYFMWLNYKDNLKEKDNEQKALQ